MRNLLLLVLLAVATAAAAQDAFVPDSTDAETRFAEFAQDLDLSDEQKAKIAPILLKNAEQARAIREKIASGDLRRFQGIRKLRSLGDELEKELEPILTKEQLEKVKARREARRQQLRERLKEQSGS